MLHAVDAQPCTVEGLTEWLELDADTVRDHLDALGENGLVEVNGRGGERRYRPTKQAKDDWESVVAVIGTAESKATEPPVPGKPD
jgi:DNA-binding transcriptional ArsR family regulator